MFWGKGKGLLLTFPVLSFFPKLAIAQEIYTLEEVKITAPAFAEVKERIVQEVKVIPQEELKSFGYTPYSGLDVRERGGFGVHENLSLRGTTFEENLVLLEGVRISDLQTGHHLMHLPFSANHLKALEILPGGASPLYGAGGFGGALNFLLEPSKQGVRSKLGFGSYDLLEYGLNLGIPLFKEKLFQLNLEEKKANGFIWNRDFDIRTFNLYTKNSKEVLFYGFVEKDFGARNFYSSKFDTEFEETRTHLFLWKRLFSMGSLSFEPAFLYRNNQDYYLLNRKNPDFYKNIHLSNLYRINLPLAYAWEDHIFTFGLEASYENLKSSRLKEYLRRNLSVFGGIKSKLRERVFITLQTRFDHYLGEKDFLSLGGGLAYLIREDLKLRTSINYSYRLPSVIELRYYAIGIKGNPNLSVEKALNTEVGIDYGGNLGEASFTLFYRKGQDLIDWVATSLGTVAKNLHLKTIGGTFDIRKSIGYHRVFFSYTYLNQSGEDLDYARYNGNYLRHNLSVGTILSLPYKLFFKGQLNYQRRLNQEGVPLIDVELEKEFKSKWKLSIWIKNLLDKKYYELKWYGTGKGVLMPPQWMGIKVEGEI